METSTHTPLPRTYLYVPPEEKSEVQALGASWDADSKCWYIEADAASEQFSRWLPGQEDEDEFTILSNHAYVAAVQVPCQHCHAPIEVICIHCEAGTVDGDELRRFTVSNISAINDTLSRQLAAWPQFQRVKPAGRNTCFANHCPRCDVPQDDILLHSEPDQAFFNISHAIPGAITLAPLDGIVQLNGDVQFEVE